MDTSKQRQRVCAVIAPRPAQGTVTAPPSKSISHRMLICAALATGESTLYRVSCAQDILATIDALRTLGAQFDLSEECEGAMTVRVTGMAAAGVRAAGESVLPCRESGSTLRFLIPLCLLSPEAAVLRGSRRLLSRPLGVYEEIFPLRIGAVRAVSEDESVRVLAAGEVLHSGCFCLPGDVSSQFISGLLFALALCEGESRICLTTPPQSRPYVDLTLEALRCFGVHAAWQDERTLVIPGGQRYHPVSAQVEGDASGAAFFEALNVMGGKVHVEGIPAESLQGDRIYRELFAVLTAPRGAALPRIDLADCPDLAPILFALAAECGGAIFTHTDRLRSKESDRIDAMQQELEKLGGRVWSRSAAPSAENRAAPDAADGDPGAWLHALAEEQGGAVCVLPSRLHPPRERLCGHNDHRVVMSLAVLATKYGGEIDDAQAVDKSLPCFFTLLRRLGADVTLQKGGKNTTDG